MEALNFVHVPKTGGQSIAALLGLPIEHHRASDYAGRDGFRFAFVRNPFDRVRSEFNWWRIVAPISEPMAQAARSMGLSEWVMSRLDLTFQPQTYWIDAPVDFVGRFEALQDGVDYILRVTGREPAVLPRLNASCVDGEYNSKARCKVRDLYASDFYRFGYE